MPLGSHSLPSFTHTHATNANTKEQTHTHTHMPCSRTHAHQRVLTHFVDARACLSAGVESKGKGEEEDRKGKGKGEEEEEGGGGSDKVRTMMMMMVEGRPREEDVGDDARDTHAPFFFLSATQKNETKNDLIVCVRWI